MGAPLECRERIIEGERLEGSGDRRRCCQTSREATSVGNAAALADDDTTTTVAIPKGGELVLTYARPETIR